MPSNQMISKSKIKRLWLFLACSSIVNIAHLLTMHLFPASRRKCRSEFYFGMDGGTKAFINKFQEVLLGQLNEFTCFTESEVARGLCFMYLQCIRWPRAPGDQTVVQRTTCQRNQCRLNPQRTHWLSPWKQMLQTWSWMPMFSLAAQMEVIWKHLHQGLCFVQLESWESFFLNVNISKTYFFK